MAIDFFTIVVQNKVRNLEYQIVFTLTPEGEYI
jgi:hypothetical protein